MVLRDGDEAGLLVGGFGDELVKVEAEEEVVGVVGEGVLVGHCGGFGVAWGFGLGSVGVLGCLAFGLED